MVSEGSGEMVLLVPGQQKVQVTESFQATVNAEAVTCHYCGHTFVAGIPRGKRIHQYAGKKLYGWDIEIACPKCQQHIYAVLEYETK